MADRYDDLILRTLGLIAYWRLNDLSGTRAVDSAGVNHGTYTGGVLLDQDGAVAGGRAASFDGVNDRVDLPLISLATYTIELWCYPVETSDASYGGLFGSNTSSSPRLFWRKTNNNVRLQTAPGDIEGGGAFFAKSVWHHVAATVAAGAQRIYIDGVERVTGAQAAPGALGLGGNLPWIGFAQWYTQGRFNDVAVYSRALTADEIAEHAAARYLSWQRGLRRGELVR